ncbi:MAG: MptD family putative ECF transporter S component [Lachnospiraceae bacterium]|nr:MptD family putative ECF transporter S component [Lachnospiraceae bacterium]
MNENSSNKLNAKDLIHVGIYTAILAVLLCVFACLGIIPVMMLSLVVIPPVIAGIPYMLFLTKVKKFGMILLVNILLGLMLWVTGMSYYATIVGTITGLIAEFIYRKGEYKSKKMGILAYAVSNLYIWSNYFGIFYNAEEYFSTRQEYGQEYIDSVQALLPAWMSPVLLIANFLFGLLGGYIGTKVLKKHFEKAGIV